MAQDNNDDIEKIEIEIPKELEDHIEIDEDAEVTVYIGEQRGSGKTIIVNEPSDPAVQEQLDTVEAIKKDLKTKNFDYSTQSDDEIGCSAFLSSRNYSVNLQDAAIEHPYCAKSVLKLTKIDEYHHSITETKVEDTVGRRYTVKSKFPIISSEKQSDDHGMAITQEEFQAECETATSFLENCNITHDFQEICKKVFLDKEAVGWGAFEVIRSLDGKIAKLNWIPACKIRVLRGWKGFVEDHGNNKRTYYQPFREKVGVEGKSPVDGTDTFEPYNPEKHGELEVGERGIIFNLRDRETGEPLIVSDDLNEEDFKNIRDRAANEILFVPKTSNLTQYYGYSDIIPVLTNVAINSLIKDYHLQFFEHNAVPRYAVIIKGAKIDPEFQKYIHDYFETEIKGKSHKTLILSLSHRGRANSVDVEFVKVDADRKEGSFLETKISNRDSILQAAKVPPSILGIAESGSLGSGRGDAQHQLWRARFVEPNQYYAERLINKLFRFGLGLTKVGIQFDPYEIRDRSAQANTFSILSSLGAMTINEIRNELNLGPVKGGDIPFVRVQNTSLLKVSSLDGEIEVNPLENTDSPETENILSDVQNQANVQMENDFKQLQDLVQDLVIANEQLSRRLDSQKDIETAQNDLEKRLDTLDDKMSSS